MTKVKWAIDAVWVAMIAYLLWDTYNKFRFMSKLIDFVGGVR